MTVRRSGISGEQTRPAKKTLGRVLVTTDDLEALRQQLQGDDPDRSVTFEFPSGEFSDADELRKLSDAELRNIDVKAPEVQVLLRQTEATAIGSPNTVESIYEQWARDRQTSRKPADLREFMFWICVNVVLVTLIAISVVYLQTDEFRSSNWRNTVAIVFVPFSLLLAGLTYTVMRYRPLSYAIVMPITREQLRRQELEDNRTRKLAIVTIGSAVIGAVIGALATGIITMITLT